jgi:GYF domain 2
MVAEMPQPVYKCCIAGIGSGALHRGAAVKSSIPGHTVCRPHADYRDSGRTVIAWGSFVPHAWYYADRNGQVGPLTLQELKDTITTLPNAAASGVLVWRDGFTAWKPAKDVVELKGQALRPPPLPSKIESSEGLTPGAHNVENNDHSGATWGYAVTSDGVPIIRNWYLLSGALGGASVSVILFLVLDKGSAALALFFAIYFAQRCYLEALGVQVMEDKVTYPVRLGDGTLPLFRKSIPIASVLQASSQRVLQNSSRRTKYGMHKTYRMYLAYLAGEFGEAKILFDTKGGRDRFLAILKFRFPHIKIYRWT